MGTIRIGVKTPQFIMVSSIDDAFKKARKFAHNEKRRTPAKRVFLAELERYGNYYDPSKCPSDYIQPDGSSPDCIHFWVYKFEKDDEFMDCGSGYSVLEPNYFNFVEEVF